MARGERQERIKALFLLLGVLFVFGCWYLLSWILKSSGNQAVPYPHETVLTALNLLFGKAARTTWKAVGVTLLRLLIGFSISFLLAGLLGTLAGVFPVFKSFLRPSILWKKAVPSAAVVIVLVAAVLGLKNNKLVNFVPSVLTFLVAFPILADSFCAGIESTEPTIQDALSVDGGKRTMKAIWFVRLPGAIPFIKTAIASSLGLSFKVLVMSEVLTSSSASEEGLGTLIVLSNQSGSLENVFAYSLIVLVLAAIVDIPQIVKKDQ